MSGRKNHKITESGIKYRNLREKLLKIFDGKCQKCGKTERLNFHHSISPVKTKNGNRGGYQSLLHIYKLIKMFPNNKPVMCLCEECHNLFHSEFGDIQLTISEDMYGKTNS